MRRFIAAVGVIAAGVVVVVIGLMNNLFTVAPAFEDLTDGFRDTVMSDEAISVAKSDVAALSAVGDEMSSTVVPTLAAQLQMEPAAFGEFLQTHFPAVATGVAELPGIAQQFEGVIGLIESQQGNFESADALPTSTIPATTLPWIILGIGVIGFLVGLWMLSGRRAASWTALATGLVVIAATLVLSFIPKAEDADAMNDAFRPVYTDQLVTDSVGAIQVVGSTGEEMQSSMIPGLAESLGMPVADVQAFIGAEFPASAAALQTMPETIGRFQTMVGAFAHQLDNYNTIKDTSLTPIAWTVLGGGAVMAVFGMLGVFAAAQARPSDEEKYRAATATS